MHVRVRVRVRRVRVRAVWAWVNTGERDDKCEVIIIIVYEEKERVGTGACGPAGAPRLVPRQRGGRARGGGGWLRRRCVGIPMVSLQLHTLLINLFVNARGFEWVQ